MTRTPPTRAPAGDFFVRHLPLFLDYLAVEKGLARNSLDAYRRDLTAFGTHLARKGVATKDRLAKRGGLVLGGAPGRVHRDADGKAVENVG